ncbi:MAG: diacylglycerol O-acyltransferase / wax synthase [Solirubrobacteraceae bacterium]|jgi:WS/DGAT/MGAT family acyltransferase|nr:diacylglycerol O-acyltransferase / wax synthase [Solirubrobacteraceae bacterium]
MASQDRLTALDTTFLHLEAGPTHMHVGSVMVFEGPAPPYDDFLDHVLGRLHLVPRYRQRLAEVPFGQGRPVWVDDPHFNPAYHLRHTALPAPGGEDQLKRLVGRLFSQRLDRSKPLWEVWLAEGIEGGRFALLAKTHHALVDGVSGVDITTVLFDHARDPAPVGPPAREWVARPLPSSATLLSQSLLERATVPNEVLRGARALWRAPREIATNFQEAVMGVGATLGAGFNAAPDSPLNVPIGPHRRFTWVDADLDRFKAIKNALGGTVNDVVLTAVSGALGNWLRSQGHDTQGLVLRAMVPVSVRADVERGALGNKVATMWAPLPVGIEDPTDAFREVHEAMAGLKESGQAVGAQVLTQLADFAPATILSQAARLQARQRFFNLVVTNVPGPQDPLYMLGRRILALYPQVPLAKNQALGVAVISYAGNLGFGLLGDYDALPDLETIAGHLESAIDDLAVAAGMPRGSARKTGSARAARSPVPAEPRPSNT